MISAITSETDARFLREKSDVEIRDHMKKGEPVLRILNSRSQDIHPEWEHWRTEGRSHDFSR